VTPDPSIKPIVNGSPPGPVSRYAVHSWLPGPVVLPSPPAELERCAPHSTPPARHVQITYRTAEPQDAQECIRIRALTRENAISEQSLAALGITASSWSEGIRAHEFLGHVCLDGSQMVGYCFGAAESGEVLVLALLPSYEHKGIGRHLLRSVTEDLQALGHDRLFLACSPDPSVRSHGFYRRLGWRSTGTFDSHGDEILERVRP
jgi:ribosomal protein S18 acetylase RimI-like enzyme